MGTNYQEIIDYLKQYCDGELKKKYFKSPYNKKTKRKTKQYTSCWSNGSKSKKYKRK